jgi:folate-binding protein YgfZ
MPTTPHHGVAVSSPAIGPGTALAPSGKVRDEFRALTSTCGVYQLNSRAKIGLTGSDRVRWLNGMVTNNVRDLTVNHGIYAFLLNPQGHILGDLLAYNLGDRILVDTDASQVAKIRATFDHYIIMDDVEVLDLTDEAAAVGIAGPDSEKVLRAAGFELPELQALQVAEILWRETKVRLVRGEHERDRSFEIWASRGEVDKIHAALSEAGAVPIGETALELYRIALGIPRYGQDIRERDLPQETEQQRALNFNKGCYVGQEIVERIRSRGNVHRKFTGLRIDGPRPENGAKIQLQDKDIGEITTAAVIPACDGDQVVALGYIRREASNSGKEVRVGESAARVSELPFADLFGQ